jgi:hypothetical protein
MDYQTARGVAFMIDYSQKREDPWSSVLPALRRCVQEHYGDASTIEEYVPEDLYAGKHSLGDNWDWVARAFLVYLVVYPRECETLPKPGIVDTFIDRTRRPEPAPIRIYTPPEGR